MIENSFFSKIRNIAYVFLIILTSECIVGGGGRWLDFGVLSIRMVLFILAFLLSLPFVINKFKDIIKNKVIISILIFAVFLFFAFINGYYRNNNHGFIIADLTSFLFLAIVPAYMAILEDENKIEKLVSIARSASIVLACIAILIHFLWIFMGQEAKLSLNSLINHLNLGGLFTFNNGTTRIYFKCSICFILPFLYNFNKVINYQKGEPKRNKILSYLLMTISLTAIILSYTRSIWLGAFAATLIFIVINIKKYKQILKGTSIVLMGFLLFVAGSWVYYGFEGVITNAVNRAALSSEYNDYDGKENIDEQKMIEMESEKVREERIDAVLNNIRKHPILGNGLGMSDNVKGEGKIEYTYLDILSKMGIIGLLSFATMLFIPFYYAYKRLKKNENSGVMVVMMCLMVCMIISSIFNPFITNPIGFSLFAVFVSSVFVTPKNLKIEKLFPKTAAEKTSLTTE